jgi:hypothetical protein
MSKQGYGTDITLVAAADLSTKQFYGVKIDSNGKAALAAAGEFAIGILQNNPALGVAATVRISGASKGIAGAAITAGALVTTDANGKIVTATLARTKTDDAGVAADALLGSNVIGVAMEGAGAANDVIQIAIVHAGASPTTVQ